MAMKVCHVVLIVVLLASARLGASAPDWLSELHKDINTMTRNIEQQVQYLTRDLESQIQNSLAGVNKAIENLPKDAEGRIITNNGGNIISINSVNGLSKIIISGHTPDGEPFVRNIEERTDDKYLYHNEIIFKPKTNSSEKIRWKLDLTTPGAKPEIITDEN